MSSVMDSPKALDPHGAGCAGCMDRRQVLARAGVATLGVAAMGVLAACGGGGGGGGYGDEGSDDGTGDAPSDGVLAQVSDIPEGGAISAEDADGKPIILTQPEAGTVVALSAICTHQACTVAPDGDQIKCPCHGSVYDLEGGNVSGPATKPLPAIDVHVADGAVVAGKA